MTWQTVSTSSDDTERLGQLLGQILASPELIELRADLGGGKTTFVRGLVRGLGSKDIVSSPTFTLNKVYRAKDLQVHHFDFYRLNEPGVLANQLAESLNEPNIITVIEWSDIVKKVLPLKRFIVEFRPVEVNEDERLIVINYPESKVDLIRKLETLWQGTRP